MLSKSREIGQLRSPRAVWNAIGHLEHRTDMSSTATMGTQLRESQKDFQSATGDDFENRPDAQKLTNCQVGLMSLLGALG